MKKSLLATVGRIGADFNTSFSFRPGQLYGCHLVIGTERGFCGDFNSLMLRMVTQLLEEKRNIMVIGSQLADLLPGERLTTMEGVNISEDISIVLESILEYLTELKKKLRNKVVRVSVSYHDEHSGDIVTRIITPASEISEPTVHRFPSAPELSLTTKFFFELFAQQSLPLSPEAVLVLSLAMENRARPDHITVALKRLEEEVERVRGKLHIIRQEEITQEIETVISSLDLHELTS